MLALLVVAFSLNDGGNVTAVSRILPVASACIFAGESSKDSALKGWGSSVFPNLVCAENAPQTGSQSAKLWRGFNLGMSQADAEKELQSMAGVKSVVISKNMLKANTTNEFALAGTPVTVTLLFADGRLKTVYLKSVSYCSQVGSAGSGPAWEARDILSQKYRVAVDYPGLEKDYTDGQVRVQLREASDGSSCFNGIRQHYTLAYISEEQGAAYDAAASRENAVKAKAAQDEF